MGKVAAIVVTYNRRAMLLECVARLLGQTGASCDILIIDNASTDGTKEAIEDMKNQRVLCRSMKQNLGGAGGFHYGMRWAVEAGYDAVWVMDDDTFPSETALACLLKADQKLGGNYGFLSSAVVWKDGTGCLMNGPVIHNDYFTQVDLLKAGIIRVEQATFVSMFLKTDVIRKAGLPLKEFFIWGDDVEYSRRLSVHVKLPCYLVGESMVTHMMEKNAGPQIALDEKERIERYRYALRNEHYLYCKEGVRGRIYYARRCLASLKNVIFQAKTFRWMRLKVVCRGIWEGFFFHPQIEYMD